MAEQTSYPDHSDLLTRLRRIEGQIRGIARMVEERRYCVDILRQVTAARRALDEASLRIMKGHIHGCVSEAIQKREGAQKIEELMETIHQFVK